MTQVGFRASPYPILISLEMHCGRRQQEVLAQHCINALGERLLRAPADADVTSPLPSPEALRGKVLLKGKTQWCVEALKRAGVESIERLPPEEGEQQPLHGVLMARQGLQRKKSIETMQA